MSERDEPFPQGVGPWSVFMSPTQNDEPKEIDSYIDFDTACCKAHDLQLRRPWPYQTVVRDVLGVQRYLVP